MVAPSVCHSNCSFHNNRTLTSALIGRTAATQPSNSCCLTLTGKITTQCQPCAKILFFGHGTTLEYKRDIFHLHLLSCRMNQVAVFFYMHFYICIFFLILVCGSWSNSGLTIYFSKCPPDYLRWLHLSISSTHSDKIIKIVRVRSWWL